MALYIGLMSGTSLDGIDAVLVDFGSTEGPPLQLRGHAHAPLEAALRAELLALNSPDKDELHRAAIAGNALARAYAAIVSELLIHASTVAREVRAIGAHGQTVRHQPGAIDGTGYSIQLLNGALLAEHTHIDVVCDLRSRDIAAGGQGAPLAPGFHAAVFGQAGQTRAVLNLGGIANLTVLHGDGRVIGFDCGPANALLDAWCQRHCGEPFDQDGRWAAGGHVITLVLEALTAEPYFAIAPPKSTGRDLFHLGWLDGILTQVAPDAPAADVQATLAALTVHAIASDLRRYAPDARELYVCGGGARNDHLMQSLALALPRITVDTTETLGLPVDQVEATAFAWLAHRHVEGCTGNLPAVTGALGPRRLGALYPAR